MLPNSLLLWMLSRLSFFPFDFFLFFQAFDCKGYRLPRSHHEVSPRCAGTHHVLRPRGRRGHRQDPSRRPKTPNELQKCDQGKRKQEELQEGRLLRPRLQVQVGEVQSGQMRQDKDLHQQGAQRDQQARPAGPRDVDFSSIDTREVSISDLVAREEFARYDAEDVDDSVRYYLMARDIIDGSDLASGYRTLTRRQGSTSTYKFCAKDGAEMKYATPDFPDGNDLYDAAKWEECQNFDLSNKGSDKGGDRKVVDEHVLERQLFTIFAEKKMEGKKIKIDNQEKNMCNYMKETWADSKILINKRTPLDSVGFAWPNRNEDGKKEMKRLERNIDAVKARAFGKGEIMQKRVIKSLIKGFRGKNRVVATVKAAILAAKYMDEKEINEIYYKQGKRVADALKKAEEEVAKNTKNYQSQKYDELWLTFLKEHTDEVNKKLRDFITNTTKLLNAQIKKEVARKTTKKQTKAKLNAVTAILNEATKYTSSKEGNLFKNPFEESCD
uniref:Uncharacterized protein n=1 Tax=Bionectria ochroleuca TaxID=29856 RepID=A0A8H7NKG9_BIOOC